MDELKGQYDVVVMAVAHKEFVSFDVRSFLKGENGVVYDVKSILNRDMVDGRL